MNPNGNSIKCSEESMDLIGYNSHCKCNRCCGICVSFPQEIRGQGSYPLRPTRKELDSKGRRKALKSAVRSSSSSLSENVTLDNNEADQSKPARSYGKFDSDIASIPSGLRKVQTQREGLMESLCLLLVMDMDKFKSIHSSAYIWI